MTVREIKTVNSEIKHLIRKINYLRDSAVNISPSLSADTVSGGNQDKIASAVAEIADCEHKLSRLRAYRNYHLDKLSKDNDIEYCIWLHLARNYSWRKIAVTTDGRPDTAESIRKRCYRYKW